MQATERNLLADIRDMLYLTLAPQQVGEWLDTPNAQLGDRKPMRCMEQGDFAAVYTCAMNLG